MTAGIVAGGTGMWQSCSQSGDGFPSLLPNTNGGDIAVGVVLAGGVSTSTTGGCGQFRPTFNASSGRLTGGTIELFDATTSGYDCEPDRSETIAHEIGHILGLNDTNNPSCYGHIMGPHVIGGNPPLAVQPDECAAADSYWTTPIEIARANNPPPNDPPPRPRDEGAADGCGDDCSPIIINFENGDYRLTGANAPVRFAMNPKREPSLMGWTAADADEAFLWLDRNHNGRVTSGAELFGTFTPLRNGDLAKNGFEALSEFDTNHDGVIDHREPIWSQLLLWRDLNHNGTSEPSEISTLESSDVTAIDLRYHWTGRHDRWGNTFRYESKISIRNKSGHAARQQPVYDIFFVSIPE